MLQENLEAVFESSVDDGSHSSSYIYRYLGKYQPRCPTLPFSSSIPRRRRAIVFYLSLYGNRQSISFGDMEAWMLIPPLFNLHQWSHMPAHEILALNTLKGGHSCINEIMYIECIITISFYQK